MVASCNNVLSVLSCAAPCCAMLTHDKINFWHPPQQLLALLLRHTACYNNLHLTHAVTLALCLQPSQHAWAWRPTQTQTVRTWHLLEHALQLALLEAFQAQRLPTMHAHPP